MAAPTHDPARFAPGTGTSTPAEANGATTNGQAVPEALTPAPAKLRLPSFDVRRKRPPVLSFLLRWDSVRRLFRLTTLLTMDFFAVLFAIFTALAVKGAWHNNYDAHAAVEATRDILAFSYLVTALLFARSGLYSGRSARPGLTKIVASLFQVMLLAFAFTIVTGQNDQYSSYYIFYGSLFFAVLYISVGRFLYDSITGFVLRAAGYERRVVLVGTGHHIEAVAHALDDGTWTGIDVVGFISLTPRPDNGLRSLGEIGDLTQVIEKHRIDEVIIADPEFPEGEAVELVDRCHQRGVRVRVAPSTMEILMHRAELVPGQSVPLFELKPPVFEGIDYTMKRAFDLVVATGLLIFLTPMMLVIAAAVRVSSHGPAIYRSKRRGVGGVPFACLKFRTMYNDADQRQADLESLNEADGALFKIRDDPRMTPVGRDPAPLLARRAARS